MELLCGGRDGGWMRIANINNGNSCPTNWKKISSPVPACRAINDNAGCYSTYFDNNKFPYQHVCGKVIGYQKGTPDGYSAFAYNKYPNKDIDGPYVDGISLTYGTPRKHLFTYASGFSSNTGTHSRFNCPCAKYPGSQPHSFMQDFHYCESGSTNVPAFGTIYTSDPLWDGKGCSLGNNCCSQAGMPWFYRDVLTKVNEKIEARICRDQVYSDEGILVRDLELYIQ